MAAAMETELFPSATNPPDISQMPYIRIPSNSAQQHFRCQNQLTYNDAQMKQNKAFKQLLGAPATKLDGSNRLKLKPWREALNREVKGLDLEADHWLDLLQTRTSGQDHTALQHTLII